MLPLCLAAATSAAASSLVTALALRRRRRKEGGPPQTQRLPLNSSTNGRELAAPVDPYSRHPRTEYLSWEQYFMLLALLSAQRSKDPHKQVGACIVGADNVIASIGYNGFPRGCPDDALSWAKRSVGGDPLETKYPYVCHAEVNAILNKNQASLKGATMYVTMFPCCDCAKLVIQAGIARVVYLEDKQQARAAGAMSSLAESYAASRILLRLAKVDLRHFSPDCSLQLSYSLRPR